MAKDRREYNGKFEEKADVLIGLFKREYLFSLDLARKEHLKTGNVNEELRNIFAERIALTHNAVISTIDDETWEINDGEIDYRIEKDGKQLNIYKEGILAGEMKHLFGVRVNHAFSG